MFSAKFKIATPSSLGKFAWFTVEKIANTLYIEERFFNNSKRRDYDMPLIYVLWHVRMFLPMFCKRNAGIVIIVSEHRDGEIVTTTLESAGFETVRGSTTRGGIKALAKLVKLAKQGTQIGFTTDGPRGPRWSFQPGAVFVAAKTGLPVVPLAGSARNAYYFKSWDAFQLPLPFSKAVLNHGEPYYITGGTDPDNIEFHRAELERRLTELTLETDEIVGARSVR